MLIRAGSIVPLLSPDVDTLASYGDAPGLVHLSERRDRLRLLAFPRGRSNAGFFERERLVSRERRGSWTLRIEGRRKRRYSIEATMATLRRPFRPCRVELDGERAAGKTVALPARGARAHGPRQAARHHRNGLQVTLPESSNVPGGAADGAEAGRQGQPPAASRSASRSSIRRILPVSVFGSSSVNSTLRG